jgi:hypothetical protein
MLSALLECVGLADRASDPAEGDTLMSDFESPSTQQDSASVRTAKGSVETLDTRLSDSQTLCESFVDSATRMQVERDVHVREPVIVKAREKKKCMGRRAITFYREVEVQGLLKIQDYATFRWGLEVDGSGVVAVGNYAFIRDAIVKNRGILTVAREAVFDNLGLTVSGNGHILLLGKGLPPRNTLRPFSNCPAGRFQCDVKVEDSGVIEIHGDACFKYGIDVADQGKIIVYGNAVFGGSVKGARRDSIVVHGLADSERVITGGITVKGKFKNGPRAKKPCHCNDRWP